MRIAILASLVFVVLGLLLIPYAGLQDDEIVFATPFSHGVDSQFEISAFGHHIPLMVISYAGTLKTALYWPLLHIARPTKWLARVPMVLVGGLTVLLFFKWAERIAGRRAAMIGAALLASDPIFLLTDTFDWGPVAIEHLLIVAGCWLMVRRRLVWAALLFGLALWNKATVVWTFAGLAAGVLVAYQPALRYMIGKRPILVRAMCAFLLGALPFVVYNVLHPNATLRTNVRLSTQDAVIKCVMLERALNGSGLFRYLVNEEDAPQPKTPRSIHGEIPVWIRDHLGENRESLLLYWILLGLLATPLWWRSTGRQTALFALVSAAVTFLAMFFTRDAGAAIHHSVLLWPMPQLFCGVAIASLRRRWLVAACAVIPIAANLLVINQYLSQFERNGAAGGFTDAQEYLLRVVPEFAQNRIYVIDWGIANGLDFLSSGKLKLEPADIPDNPDPSQRKDIDAMIADPGAVFLDHVPGLEFFPREAERLVQIAGGSGRHKTILRVISDSNRRAVFEVFRLER